MGSQLADFSEKTIFADTILDWGKEHSGKKLIEVWSANPNYLRWAANLQANKCSSPPSQSIVERIKIAHLLSTGQVEDSIRQFESFQEWQKITELGEGLEDLPRPSREDCLRILNNCNLLCGHHDLDGIYSLAIAIAKGGALEFGKIRGAFSRLRLFRYGFKNLAEYTQAIAASAEDVVVIIDYAAHPNATLTLDHHTTSLSYWELGSDLPCGIYAPSMPSCPRLLATFCGLRVSEEILCGCDMIDGALYISIEQASDLNNPFVALELALSLDVSEVISKKVILTLAEHELDPWAILSQASWKARVDLLKLELEEQRSYWGRKERVKLVNDFVAIADARLAPYSATRFRYLPFETEESRARPYMITIRPSGLSKVNLSIARNPFYSSPHFFLIDSPNLGALAKSLGKGGGRAEIGSVTLDVQQLSASLDLAIQKLSPKTAE